MRFDIDYSHAKTMATRLQSFLEGSPKKLSRSSAIEAVAQMLGFNNRNEMAARIDAEATIDQSAHTIAVYQQVIEETKDWPIGRGIHDSLQRRVKELSDGYETDNLVLEYDRRMAAEEEVQSYEFDLPFKARSGWEFTTENDKWSCPIFIEDPENPDGDSLRGDFVVTFEPNSAKVITAYGTVDGDDIGYRPSTTAPASKANPASDKVTSPQIEPNDTAETRDTEIGKTAMMIYEAALDAGHGMAFKDVIHAQAENSDLSVLHHVEELLCTRFSTNHHQAALIARAFHGDGEMKAAAKEGFKDERLLARTLVNNSLDVAERYWIGNLS